MQPESVYYRIGGLWPSRRINLLADLETHTFLSNSEIYGLCVDVLDGEELGHLFPVRRDIEKFLGWK